MPENIFDRINTQYASLTRTEKRLADYIFANRNDLQYLSITSFAEHCKVADATVFRFCKALGFGGYNEFKFALARSLIGTPEAAPAADVSVYGKVNQDDSFDSMCKKLYNTQISALSQTLEQADEAVFRRAAQLLTNADRVYCFGQGGSLVMAMEAWSRFISVSPKFYYIEDVHLQAMAASLLNENDVIIFFSYSGATKDMIELLRPAKARGIKIVLVTRYEKSPGAALADAVLLCGANEGPLQVGSISAKVAQLMVVDVLFNCYWQINAEECERSIELTAGSTAKKLL
ncbi:MAG: MurR/RpiR family transcriptional regulator [Angelakisella sp.]